MVRQKEFLRKAKPKSKKEQKLEIADDFLAAGVEHEEAAGKWRAGDAAKSMRFFQRAIEVYEQGLQTWPNNLDLAYNKARVQLEICTHPVLVGQLKQPLLEVLQIALGSHRHALELSPENFDTLFNTSQVLRSIAEEVAGADALPSSEAIKLLEEAWELQTKCFQIQLVRYQESQEEERMANEQAAAGINAQQSEMQTEAEAASEEAEAEGEEEEQWVAIVEPVTKDTLIDTVVAQLETLTTLCSILADSPDSAPPSALSFAEKHSSDLLSKIPELSHDKPERHQEIALAKSNFVAALLAAGAKLGKIDPPTYKKELEAVFSAPELQASTSTEALLAHAKALMTFASAFRENNPAFDPTATATPRWNALTEASKKLTAASKIAGVDQDDLAKTHLLRGDCSMGLHNLQYPPASHKLATEQAPQLLKNAEIYYRNASKLSGEAEEKAVANFRSSVAAEMARQGSPGGDGFVVEKVLAECKLGTQWGVEQLEDMVFDGVLPPMP